MSDSGNSGGRLRYILGGGAVLVLIAGVAIWWFVFRGDAPAEVDNVAANEQLDAELEEAAAAGDAPVIEDFDGEINGTWTVDNTIGDLTFDSASGSFAGFRVDEDLIGPGSVVAVGRTGDVTGSIDISGGELVAAAIDIDLSTLTSNRVGRDSAIQRALDTARFPTATFDLTTSVPLPEGAATGELFSVTAVGDLTIHGITQTASFTIEANVRRDGIAVVTGSTNAVWQGYGITPPSAPIVASVDDEGVVEFQLLLTK